LGPVHGDARSRRAISLNAHTSPLKATVEGDERDADSGAAGRTAQRDADTSAALPAPHADMMKKIMC
jgi:hypothetical protein